MSICELGLAVGPEILVPEAPDDLVVALESADHQDLFEQLGTLGQGIELALVDPAWNQVVPGALGGALGEDRCLDVQEAQVVEIVANRPCGRVPGNDVLLELGSSQVQVTVLETDGLGGLDPVFDLEGRCLGPAQYLELIHQDLDGAGGHLGIDHVIGPIHNGASYAKDKFASQVVGLGMDLGGNLGVEHDLGDPLTVPEIYEYYATVIPAALHPAHEHNLCVNVCIP